MYNFITNVLEPVSYLLFTFGYLLISSKNKDFKIRVLFYLHAISFLLMLIACQYSFENIPNIFIYDTQLFLSTTFICLYYRNLLNEKWLKQVLTIVPFIALSYLLYRFFGKGFLFDSMGYSILSFIIIILVFVFFRQTLKNVTEEPLAQNEDIWINAGLLIYYLGSLFIFLFFYFLTQKILITYTDEQRDELTNLWGFHNILLFISAVCTIPGLLWATFHKK